MTTTTMCALSSSSITGDKIKNKANEELGSIHDLMIDCNSGKVAYAVMTSGGFLGMGNKLFAIPFTALQCDRQNQCFVLDASKEKFEEADGFDKDNWPDMANMQWAETTHSRFEAKPYWAL